MDLFSALLGLLSAAIAQRWYWAVAIGVVLAIGLNGITDWVSYGNALLHARELAIDAVRFSAWALAFFAMKVWLRSLPIMARKEKSE